LLYQGKVNSDFVAYTQVWMLLFLRQAKENNPSRQGFRKPKATWHSEQWCH